MASTFHGLETSRRGIYTQQSALHTLGHNVANANTKGYSRQRVNMATTSPYPNPAMNRPNLPGQMGTGVQTGSIQRIREAFLDVQYRSENTKLGYWESRAESLTKMENIMNELKGTGLSNSMDTFWQSLQDLALNSVNSGAKAVVRERGTALAQTFTYLAESLHSVRSDLRNELEVGVSKVNDLMDSIHDLNRQIADVEPHGYLPNDLYDRRDTLIDELSSYVNIKVEYVRNGGKPAAQAVGTAIIKLVDQNKDVGFLVGPHQVDHLSFSFKGEDGSVDSMTLGNKTIPAADFLATGKLRGLMESYGYVTENGKVEGNLTNMLNELDNMAFTFATEFNKVHMSGLSPNELAAWEKAKEADPTAKLEDYNKEIAFFVDETGKTPASADKKGFASRITLSAEIKESLDNIATASPDNPTVGDSKGILNLAKVVYEKYDYQGGGTAEPASFGNYFQKVIGEMAVTTKQAHRLNENSETLTLAVNERRASVSNVSLDEEMTNMIQFQQAYNASARMITMIDECLDKIINGLGVGGR